MDNQQYESYPYKCAYLWHLWNVEKLTGSQMLDRVIEMQDWLDSNCWENGNRTFLWDNNNSTFPFQYNRDYNGSVNKAYVHEITLSNFIAFKRKDDLLAFMLRWGIQDTNVNHTDYPKYE